MLSTHLRNVALSLAGLAIATSSGAWAQTALRDPWSGFYAGINAGSVWGDSSALLTGDDVGGNGAGNVFLNIASASDPIFGYIPRSLALSPDRFIGGAQLGYLTRLSSHIVIGIEADAQMASANDRSGVIGDFFSTAYLALAAQQNLDWFASLRVRLGYLINDNLLVFGSGGMAVGKTEVHASIDNVGGLPLSASGPISVLSCSSMTTCLAGTSSETSASWAFGGGFEWSLTSTLSFKAEYLRLDFGSQTVRMMAVAPTIGDAFVDAKIRHTYDIARVGLNVRF